jgi:gluconolactonase
MTRITRTVVAVAAALVAVTSMPARAQHAVGTINDRNPDAIVDLRTKAGVALVSGLWRYKDAAIVPTEFRAPGADLKPTGMPISTFDVMPKAGVAGYDDHDWTAIDATSLEARRTNGRLSLGWYRLTVTIPERVGQLQTSGSTVVFEIVVDDYAEVWVDGQFPRTFGQASGTMVRGYNMPNRIVIARNARPGQRISIAVLGINGPLSDPPANFVWIRSATLEFFAPRPGHGTPVPMTVERLDPAIDSIVAKEAQLERVADGFEFIEGPVWVADGYLLFSDPNRNTIYRYSPDEGVGVFRVKSGYTGADVGRYHQPGSNGLTLDPMGRLTINEHGNRRVTRLEVNGVLTVLADRFEGKRLNSPNDVVYRSDGTLYFSDPPFGLPEVFSDPAKELPYSGVFRVKDGAIALVSRDLAGPNGLAFSPDERYLYVDNWDPAKKVVMRYEVQADGSLANGKVFFDMTRAPGEEALDGLKVDQRGNLYVSGPGGLWILSPDGRHLGTLHTPELPANFAFGDADGRTLYLTARTGLYRLPLNVPGIGPAFRQATTATQ